MSNCNCDNHTTCHCEGDANKCNSCLGKCGDSTKTTLPEGILEYTNGDVTGANIAQKYNDETGLHSSTRKGCYMPSPELPKVNCYKRVLTKFGFITAPSDYCPTACDMDRLEMQERINAGVTITNSIGYVYLNIEDALAGKPINNGVTDVITLLNGNPAVGSVTTAAVVPVGSFANILTSFDGTKIISTLKELVIVPVVMTSVPCGDEHDCGCD
jgi:hypothetical protein